MAQPVWITPAGSLGIIPEGVFYQIPLLADEPVTQAPLKFRIIAGELPAGVQCSANGLIAGIPQAIASVQGVPLEVNRDVTSKFAIRVYTETVINGQTIIDRLADRTFTITVTGPDAPRFVTPAGTVASFYDGSVVEGVQIEYTDPDPDEVRVVRLIAGQLPPGCTLSADGLISGYIDANPDIDAVAGFGRDGQGYSEFPFDFQTKIDDITYEFTLEVSDGSLSDVRTFNIQVFTKNSLTADTTEITADNTFITTDEGPIRTPIIITPQGLIDTIRSDNFFAFRFQGLDLDGDQISYQLTGSIPGLTLDPTSGWLYGYVPNLGLSEEVYDFQVRVFKTLAPVYISNPYDYSLAINGPVNSEITWLTPTNLGTIVNGATSTLYVKAVSRAGLELQYRLLSGSASSLPQGLQLLPSGHIAGRCSFDTFALDGGTTTFDVISQNRTPGPTTFDLKFTFTVQVYSVNEVVNITKQFSITVIREFNEPYENLYIQAMPPINDREIIDDLLQDPQIFPPDLLYRPDDPNFGLATRVVYRHAFGLRASTIAEYYSSLYLNHYWKNLVLGQIEVAEARNAAGEVIYEVVYSKVIDNLLNDEGESVSKAVNLPYTVYDDYGDPIDVVYPNSLIDMRDQVIDTVGQVGNVLPTWMISKQSDGRVLGFTPAWVIAYVKPGQGQRVAYNIQTQYGDQLNLIDFKVDRYELDGLLTKNWDPVTDQWVPTPPTLTTFDYNTPLISPTTFDGNSLLFVAPVDMYSTTQAYDKYLIFPYRNIINPETAGSPLAVGWTNNSGNSVSWPNDDSDPITWFRNP